MSLTQVGNSAILNLSRERKTSMKEARMTTLWYRRHDTAAWYWWHFVFLSIQFVFPFSDRHIHLLLLKSCRFHQLMHSLIIALTLRQWNGHCGLVDFPHRTAETCVPSITRCVCYRRRETGAMWLYFATLIVSPMFYTAVPSASVNIISRKYRVDIQK